MVNLIESGVRHILRWFYGRKAKSKILRLQTAGNPAAEQLARAISGTIDGALSPDEKAWIDQIERLRSVLEASSGQVAVTDYGAGGPEDSRTEEEMRVGVVTNRDISAVCRASKPHFWALLLFKLIREFRPAQCLELGTCLGISAAYQAAALKLNNGGTLITIEGAKALADLSAENLRNLGLNNATVINGRFEDTLSTVLAQNKLFDYAFIDGHHDEAATIAYFEQLIPHLSGKSLLVFDDISWSDGMRRAWATISRDERVRISLNLKAIGLCVMDADISTKHNFSIPLI